jgi:hypothetical protein
LGISSFAFGRAISIPRKRSRGYVARPQNNGGR